MKVDNNDNAVNTGVTVETIKPRHYMLKNGKCLLIREATPTDAKDMIQYLNIVGGESDFLLFGFGEFRLSVEQEMAYLAGASKDPNTLMIAGFIDEKLVSVAQISGSPRHRISHNAEISISVSQAYWHQGIGKEMMASLIQFVKIHPLIRQIKLEVRSDNKNAITLYEQLGFKRVGLLKDEMCVDDIFYDLLIMQKRVDS